MPILIEMENKESEGIEANLWYPPVGTPQKVLDAMPGPDAIPTILELIIGIPPGKETARQVERAIFSLNEFRKGIFQDFKDGLLD